MSGSDVRDAQPVGKDRLIVKGDESRLTAQRAEDIEQVLRIP